MNKFDTLYRTFESNLSISPSIIGEALPNEAPVAGNQQQTGPNSNQPQTPAPAEVKQPAEAVTTEGKKFLVELALKALSVDPDNITATDKDIFNTEITVENADDMLQRIQAIVDLYS